MMVVQVGQMEIEQAIGVMEANGIMTSMRMIRMDIEVKRGSRLEIIDTDTL